MLLHPVIEKLKHLRLIEIASQLKNQTAHPDINSLNFEERLSLLIDM